MLRPKKLYRGTCKRQASEIIAKMSAGGAQPNTGCGKPDESAVAAQMGNEGTGTGISLDRRFNECVAMLRTGKNFNFQPLTHAEKSTLKCKTRKKYYNPFNRSDAKIRSLIMAAISRAPEKLSAILPNGLSEYSESEINAKRFASGNQDNSVVVEIKIDRGYLAKGSNTESERGWIAFNSAPVTAAVIKV